MNWADLEKPLGVEVVAVNANKWFLLGQFMIALWGLQRDSNSQIFFHLWSCHFATEHFGFDDMMIPRTPWDLTRSRKACIEKAHFHLEFPNQIWQA